MNATSLVDVVDTVAEAAALSVPPLIVTETVRDFLDAESIGAGPLRITRIGEGQSNATFRIQREDADVILRRGPRPPLAKSTHDMVREARVQTALSTCGFPVPTILAVHSTDDLLGVPFYVMERLDGDVVTSRLPKRFDTPERRHGMVDAAVDTLAQLHSLDVTRSPLAELGRPEGYLTRQVERFTQLWPNNTLRDIPLVNELGRWLAQNEPVTQRHSVIHGDYRIGNLMFAPQDEPRVQAVLDWEMATLGDPLADLGYLVATFSAPDARPTVMELTTVTQSGDFPSRDDLVERYAHSSELDLSDLNWYQVLALWKASIFCEAIYTRYLKGESPDDESFSRSLKHGVPDLLDSAHDLIH